MILEGIVTTTNEDGSVNISPMGPLVDAAMNQFVLRPYQTSRTYRNLKREPQGVLHVIDDVELLARAAVNQLQTPPETFPAEVVSGRVLAECCRWYEFEVANLDDREPRTRIECDVVHQGRLRDMFGFNRAKHAVLEAAILATRIEFLPAEEILRQFESLAIPVQKTAGPEEEAAFTFLQRYVHDAIASKRAPASSSSESAS